MAKNIRKSVITHCKSIMSYYRKQNAERTWPTVNFKNQIETSSQEMAINVNQRQRGLKDIKKIKNICYQELKLEIGHRFKVGKTLLK